MLTGWQAIYTIHKPQTFEIGLQRRREKDRKKQRYSLMA